MSSKVCWASGITLISASGEASTQKGEACIAWLSITAGSYNERAGSFVQIRSRFFLFVENSHKRKLSYFSSILNLVILFSAFITNCGVMRPSIL